MMLTFLVNLYEDENHFIPLITCKKEESIL